MFITFVKKSLLYFFIFIFLILWQATAFPIDSTELRLQTWTSMPPPYIVNFGTQQINTSNGGVIASTSSSCMPGYQLQYVVNIVDEISNIWLETCLAENKKIMANKRANVNYFGTGKITFAYWYICRPCKGCPPVAANC